MIIIIFTHCKFWPVFLWKNNDNRSNGAFSAKLTIYGIKSAVRRFLFKIRDIPTKTKGKKSDPWRRFFYRVKKANPVKKATTVPLFLPYVRFFYLHFFGIVGGKYETINVPMLTSNHTCTLHCVLYVYCNHVCQCDFDIAYQICQYVWKVIFFLKKSCWIYVWRKFSLAK